MGNYIRGYQVSKDSIEVFNVHACRDIFMKLLTLGSAVIIAMVAGCLGHNGTGKLSANPDPESVFRKPISRDVVEACTLVCDFYYFMEFEGVKCAISNKEIFSRWSQQEIRGVYCELEAKYLFSWWLHFGSSDARIIVNEDMRRAQGRDDFEAIICDVSNSASPYLRIYQERHGKWRDKLLGQLGKEYHPPSNEMFFYEFVQDVAVKNKLSIIFDREVMYVDEAIRVHLPSGPQSAESMLASALSQVGLSYCLQGGVVYIVSSGERGRIWTIDKS